MDRLGEIRRTGDDDPDFGTVPEGRDRSASSRAQRADPATLPDRSPDVATDNPVFEPPFLGQQGRQGLAVDDIAAYINETALFRNQWGFRPEKSTGPDGTETVETDDEFKDRIRPIFREQLARCKAGGPPRAVRWSTATSPPTPTATTSSSGPTRPAPIGELARFSLSRQSEAPHLCIADFFRPIDSRRASTTPRSTS